jgi:(p)ppGpp synthase/HD superfamily hydrolase
MNDVIKIAKALDFAARKHTGQRRKGLAEEPYINHLAEVALLLAEATEGKDTDLVVAGLLHDCIEDQGVRKEDLEKMFGADVASLVQEVTDDKSLPKQERKQLQVTQTPHKSARAKLLKLADKISNLRSMKSSPPKDWDATRRREYFEWAKAVVAGCGDASTFLNAKFEEAYRSGVY